MIIKSLADRKLVMQGPADALPSAQALELCAKFKAAHLLKPHGVVKYWQLYVFQGSPQIQQILYNF